MGKAAFLIIFTFIEFIYPQWSNDPAVNLTVGYGLNGQLASDDKGGCYISYETETTFYPFKTDIVRLDKYGNQLWKTRIKGDYPEQWQNKIVADGKGGVIMSFVDDSLVSMYVDSLILKLQRIDSQGNLLWGEKGKRINVKGNDFGLSAIAADGEGGCAVAWIDNYESREYRINRINSIGELMWGDSGIVCGTNMYGWVPLLKRLTGGNYVFAVGNLIKFFSPEGNLIYQNSLQYTVGALQSDNEGNILLLGGEAIGLNNRLLVYYKNSTGNDIWDESYKFLADSLTGGFNSFYKDDYFYLIWTGKRNGIQYVPMFQILRRDGTKVFPDNIALSNARTYSLAFGIIPSDYSTVVIVRADSSAPIKGFYAQKFDTLGNSVWGKNVLVTIFNGLSTVSDCNGGVIHLAYKDEFTIIAQQVNTYGRLGDVITNVKENNELIDKNNFYLYQNYPNPFNSETNIRYTLSFDSEVEIELYNTLGELIKIITPGFQSKGSNSITLNMNNFPSGIYFCQVKAGEKKQIIKIIVLK